MITPIITADVVAHAIVAASRETGEQPLDVALGNPAMRARHYAMHALIRVFPDMEILKIVQMVGAPGKPQFFWRNAKMQVADPRRSFVHAKWWDNKSFQRVVDAVFRAAERPTPAARVSPAPARPAESLYELPSQRFLRLEREAAAGRSAPDQSVKP